MSLTAALHYPWIDIHNIAWLKKVILYWHDVHTIVPQSYGDPYHSYEAQVLKDEGFLQPLLVEPDTYEVQAASSEFQTYLSTREAQLLLHDKCPQNVRYPSTETGDFARLHPDKISYEIFQNLLLLDAIQDQNGWLIMNSNVVNYYMTLLASHIVDNRGLAPLADRGIFDTLAGKVRRGEKPRPFIPTDELIRETLLAKMLVKVHAVAPSTPITDIVAFRRQHADELGNFRTKMGELMETLRGEFASEEAFQQRIQDICINEIQPAQNEISRAMDSLRIRHRLEGLTTMLFAAPGYLLSNEIFQPILHQYASIATVGLAGAVVFSVQSARYALDKEATLRGNPYSYIYHAQQSFRPNHWKRLRL